MNKYLIIILSMLVMVGCRPKGILSEKQMEEALYQVHVAEATLLERSFTPSTEETQGYYGTTLAKMGITQAQFDSSLTYYTHHSKTFDKIYPRVVERLQKDVERLEQELNDRPKMVKKVEEWEEYEYKCLFGLENEYHFFPEPYPDYVFYRQPRKKIKNIAEKFARIGKM